MNTSVFGIDLNIPCEDQRCIFPVHQDLLSTFFQRDETQLRDDENDEQQEGGYEMLCVFFIKHVLFCWSK